jgi:SAM-dependent methyltransferase
VTAFGAYARYYDLLYRDKAYGEEAAHLDALVRAQVPAARSLLELGCGTGGHAVELAKHGYEVDGIDLSETMLAVAQSHASPSLRFTHGDARSVRLGRTFDAVISVFHVMSYQATNADLAAAFATARAHLAVGGVFVFDCWYGPAVLTDRPVVRVRTIEDDSLVVTRIAEPVMHAAEDLVDVNYHVFLRDKQTEATSELRETHRMRYLFSPEVELLLAAAGFELVRAAEWLSGAPLSFRSWNACFVARAL